jgi:hypothetical protein
MRRFKVQKKTLLEVSKRAHKCLIVLPNNIKLLSALSIYAFVAAIPIVPISTRVLVSIIQSFDQRWRL